MHYEHIQLLDDILNLRGSHTQKKNPPTGQRIFLQLLAEWLVLLGAPDSATLYRDTVPRAPVLWEVFTFFFVWG